MAVYRHRAVTLMELMCVLLFISVGYVGVARLTSHAVRLTERADRRAQLTACAFTELERLRALAAMHPDLQPSFVRSVPGMNARLWISHDETPQAPLHQIQVVAEALETSPPFTVTLTGWVRRP
jgi:Tfp pilus assembly protein PilV